MATPKTGPDEYIAARVKNLRAIMAEKKLPALLVTYFPDVSYLTGFEGDDSFCLVTPDRVVLISDFRYTEQISLEAPWVDLVIRKKGILEEVAKVLKKLKITKLGVQAESMTLQQRDGLLGYFTKGSKPRLVPAADVVVDLRNIKDAREVQIIEEAIAVAENGFLALKAKLEVGMTENEIASLLVHEMRKRGASGSSFDTIVAVGANGSLPHYRPGNVKLQNNTPLLVDWGAVYKGYCSDLTRMIFVGEVPPAIEKIYLVVREAQQAAIAGIKPGADARKVDALARNIIKKAGYGKNFGHGLGHGVGRDIHEAIRFSPMVRGLKLKPGMLMTVEPGIYLPGVGGVRLEDDILVTETGCRVLSTLPTTLESASL